MKSLALLASLLLIAVVLLTFLKSKLGGAGDNGPWPFFAKKLLTTPEQVLYFRLVSALPDHIVLAQVQLSRFLGVAKGNDFHKWNNRINRQSVDFLVCAKDSAVIAAIELDDSSHTRPDRIKSDAKKDKAIGDAGVRMVRWHVKSMPDTAAIISAIAQPVQATPGSPTSAVPKRAIGN